MSGSKQAITSSMDYGRYGSQSSARSRLPRTHRSSGTGDTRPECRAIVDNGSMCGETQTLRITDELKRLYENRLRKLDEDIGEDAAGDSGQIKVNVLQSWVQDLLEQNAELVHTVEELEREIGHRVKLLEEKLMESARACREYMTKIHDFESEMREAAADKVKEERLQCRLGNLKSDISNLLKFICRAREQGVWSADGLVFYEVAQEDIFRCSPHSYQQAPFPQVASGFAYPSGGNGSVVQPLVNGSAVQPVASGSAVPPVGSGSVVVPLPPKTPKKVKLSLELALNKVNKNLSSTSYDDATKQSPEELAKKDALIKKLEAELRALQQRSAGGTDGEIATLKEHLGLKDSQIRALIQRIQELREDIIKKSGAVQKLLNKSTQDAGTMTDESSSGTFATKTCYDNEPNAWKERASVSRSEILRTQSELHRVELATIAKHNDNVILAKQLEESELFLEMSLRDKERLAEELLILDKRLDDKSMEITLLTKSMAEMEKAAKDMQTALTAEVAEKHDLTIMLRRELYHLEDQCRQADKQTHFKDDIIKEMRKEIKQARSKITVLEQELLETSHNADKSRRFSSSPQLGHNFPSRIQSIQYLKHKPVESTEDQETSGPARSAASTNLCRDSTISDNLHPKSTQCDLPIKGPKPRSKVSRFHRHSIGDCTPSTGYHCGDVSGQHPSNSDAKTRNNHRSYSPPCKDVHEAESNHLSRNLTFPGEERQSLSATYDEDTMRLQESLKRKKAELEKVNNEVDALRGELQFKDDRIHSLEARLQGQQYQQRDSRSSQQSEHERKVRQVEESLAAAKIQMKKSFQEFKAAQSRLGDVDNSPNVARMEEYDRLCHKENAALEAMRKEINALLEQIKERETKISNQDMELDALHEKLISTQNSHKNVKELSDKYINDLRVAEQNQKESERRIHELQDSLKRAQDSMQGCLLKLEESTKSPADISKTVIVTEARAFQSKAEEGQAAFDNMKAEMDFLLNNLHSREGQIKELEKIIEGLQNSLEKTQMQLMHVQTNANAYLKDRDRSYRKEEEAREKIAALQTELQGTVMEKQKSWHALRGAGASADARKISFAPIHMAVSDYEATFEKEAVATDDMKEELKSLLRDLKERDGEIAAQAQTIEKLQAELISTQKTLQEMQRKEVASLGDRRRAQQDSDTKILELEGALKAARADLHQSQDRFTNLEIDRRTRNVAFHNTVPEARAGPSDEWRALEKARTEISEIAQKLEARERHIKKQDEVIHALQAALDQAQGEVSKLQTSSATRPDPSAQRANLENKQRIERMKTAIKASEDEFGQSQERIKTLERNLNSPRSYAKPSNRPTSSNMDEFRLNTVEAQAAVEDMMEEMESMIKNINSREKHISELENMISSLQHTLAQYEQEVTELRAKTEAIEREKRTSELNLKDREKKIQQLQEQMNSTQINMKKSFEKLQASKQQADAQEYQAMAREGQLAMDKMTDEMKNVINAVNSREKLLSQKEEIIRNLQRSLEQTKTDLAAIQKKASLYLKDKENAENTRKESERKLEKLQAELEHAQDELRTKIEQFNSYEVQSEVQIKSPYLQKPVEPTKSIIRSSTPYREKDDQNKALAMDLQHCQKENKILSEKIVALESTARSMQGRRNDTTDRDKDRQISDLKSALDRSRGEIQSLNDKIKVYELQISEKPSQKSVVALRRSVVRDTTDYRGKDQEANKTIQKLKAEIDELVAELERRDNQTGAQEEMIGLLRQQLAKAQSDAKGLQQTIDTYAKNLDQLMKDQDGLQGLQNRLTTLEIDLKLARQQVASHEETIQFQRKTIADMERNMDHHTSFNPDITASLQQKDRQIQTLEEEINNLRTTSHQPISYISRPKRHLNASEETKVYLGRSKSCQDLKSILARKDMEIDALEAEVEELQYKLKQADMGASSVRQQQAPQESKRLVDKTRSRQDLEAKLRQNNKQIQELEDEMLALENKLKQSSKEASGLRDQLQANKRPVDKTFSHQDLEAKLQQKDRQIRQLEEDVNTLENRFKQAKREASSLQEQLEACHDSKRHVDKTLSREDLEAKLHKKDNQIRQLEEEVNKLQRSMKESIKQASNLQEQLQASQGSKRPVDKTLSHQELEAKLREKNKQIKELEDDLNTLEKQFKQALKEASNLRQQLQDVEQMGTSKSKTHPEMMAKLHEKDRQIAASEDELDTLRNRLKQSQMDSINLKQDLEMAKEMEAVGRKKLLDPKDRQIDALQQEVQDLRRSLQQCRTEAASVRQDLQITEEKERYGGKGTINPEVKAQLEEKNRKINVLEEELGTLRNNLKQSKMDADNLRQDIKFTEDRGKLGVKSILDADCIAKLREKDKQIDDLDEEVNKLRSSLKHAKTELADLKENLEMAEERSQSGKKCLTDPDVKAKLREKDDKIDTLEAELNEFRRTLKNSKLELSTLREDLKMAEERANTDVKPIVTAIKSSAKCREKDSRIEDLEGEINSLRNALAKCKSELHEKANKIESLERELNLLRHNLKSSKQELSTIKEDLVEERGRMGDRSAKDADLKRILSEKSQRIDTLEHELDLARNAENNYKKEADRLKQDIKILEERLNVQPGNDSGKYDSLKKHLEEKNRQIENQEEEMNLLRNTMNNYKREIGELKRALGDAQKDLPELQRELQASQERVMSKGEAVNFLQGTLDTTQDELHKLQLEIERMLRERGESQTAIQGLQSELDKAKRDGQKAKEMMATIEEQQKELNNYRKQLEQLQAELDRARAEIQSLKATLQAKEKLLADQEEMAAIQKDTIKRSQDEFNRLKDRLEMEMRIKVSQEDMQTQVKNQQVTIGNLQQALLSTKQQLEELQGRGSFDVSAGWMGWTQNGNSSKRNVHDV